MKNWEYEPLNGADVRCKETCLRAESLTSWKRN